MSVVGFDIGNDNCVIAIVKPKAIQILQNDVSKYETPSVVSFTKDRRQIGSAGASSAGMYPMCTISQIKRLIGQNYDDPGMAEEFKLLPFKTTRGADGGILIEIEYLKKTEVFTPVEILAMLLSHLKQMAERNGDGTPVVDCVIGIPSYFNDFQRVAYLNAAEIAELNPLRLIHDGTATAIGYGYVNQDIKSPTILVFVDVGHCDTQVTVAKFEDKKVTILAHTFDRNVGGRNFDRILYKYFADKFKEKHNIDIDVDDNNSHHKARVRLMAACEKAKKVLTANREANISVDCLVDDKDLVGSIKREDFDSLSKYLVERVIKACEDALMDLELTKSDIHSVELVGSGSRIPAIGSFIGEFFEKQPNRTLNGSECVARGCALQGVIFRSGNNRGYTYEVQDSIPYPVVFTVRQQPSISRANFKDSKYFLNNRQIEVSGRKSSSRVDSKDSGKFIKNRQSEESNRRSESSSVQDSIPFSIGFTLRQKSNEYIQNQLPHWGSKDDSRNSTKPRNSSSSHATEAEAILDQFHSTKIFPKCHEFPYDFRLNIQYPSQDFILSSFNEYQSAANACQRSRHFKVDAFQMDSNLPCTVTVEISFNIHGVVVVQSAKTEKEKNYGPFYTSKYLEAINFDEISPIGMTPESKNKAKERENCLLQCDKQVEAIQHQKNALETFIYDIRIKLNDRYRSFVKVLENQTILKNLDNAECFINDEGDHDIAVYMAQLQALQKLVYPIESRYKHREECTQAIKELENSISNQKTSASYNLVKSYCSYTEELLSAILQLLRILPKDIEQLPILVEKIRRITNTINEINHVQRDVSTMTEKYANLFREESRDSLSAHLADNLKHTLHVLEEGDKVEEARGQAVARLLYTSFDSKAELIFLTCFGITGNKEFDNLLQMVYNTCNGIENYCEEMKPRYIPLDDIKSMQKELDGLRQKIQQYVVLVEAHAQASKNSGKLNPQGSSTKEATVTPAAEDEITDLEKQLFGRYRYFVRSDEKKSISGIIQSLNRQTAYGKPLQLKPQFTSVLNSIKKRYQEYKNERVQAVGEFYECVFEIRLTITSMSNNSIKLEVLRICEQAEKWLDRTFPKPRSDWMELDDKMWSSDIRMKMEKFKTSCENLIQYPGVETGEAK